MKKYEPKIRHEVQKVLDHLGLTAAHVTVNDYGFFELDRKCGTICPIHGIRIGDDTAAADVTPIINLVSDWLNENYMTLSNLIIAIDELKSFANPPSAASKAKNALPKQIGIYEGPQGLTIAYDNWKLKGSWNWEINRDGSITAFHYNAASKKNRVAFITALKRRPETEHIKLGEALAVWRRKYDTLSHRVIKLRNSLDTCNI